MDQRDDRSLEVTRRISDYLREVRQQRLSQQALLVMKAEVFFLMAEQYDVEHQVERADECRAIAVAAWQMAGVD